MRLLIAILTAAMTFCLAACAQGNQKQESNKMNKKAVVVYFSATGTTKAVAEKIASVAHADIIAIEPEQPYTSADLDWNDKQSRSSVEMNNPGSRPAINNQRNSLDNYDVVFIGYPIWWDLAPRVVNTFIESTNLTDKTVIPFATSGGSGINNSVAQLKALYPALDWREGKLLNSISGKTVSDWVESLNL